METVLFLVACGLSICAFIAVFGWRAELRVSRRLLDEAIVARRQPLSSSGTAKAARLWGSSGGEIEFVRLVDDGDAVVLLLTDHDHWPSEDEVTDGAHYALRLRKSERGG